MFALVGSNDELTVAKGLFLFTLNSKKFRLHYFCLKKKQHINFPELSIYRLRKVNVTKHNLKIK